MIFPESSVALKYVAYRGWWSNLKPVFMNTNILLFCKIALCYNVTASTTSDWTSSHFFESDFHCDSYIWVETHIKFEFSRNTYWAQIWLKLRFKSSEIHHAFEFGVARWSASIRDAAGHYPTRATRPVTRPVLNRHTWAQGGELSRISPPRKILGWDSPPSWGVLFGKIFPPFGKIFPSSKEFPP